MIKLREAQATDLKDLLNLFSEMYGKEVEQTDEKTTLIWNRMLTDQFYHIIVAEEDGKIVSTCSCIIIQSLAYEHRPYAIVDNIVTRSEYRAQGLATACLEEAARIAESEGCFRMMLATTSKLESTYRFYEKLGYDRNEMTAFTQWLF
ncbi:MAG TPA: GNAT family N-acetyltransferase [Ruminococcaceae bacterium]|nr:GNAT family N-acetyltransferase [Oscillospiraceae bacterium]